MYLSRNDWQSLIFSSFGALSILVSCQPNVLGHELHNWDAQISKADKLNKAGKRKEALSLLIDSFKQLNGISHSRVNHQKELEKSLLELSKSYRLASDLKSEYKTLIMLSAFYRYLRATDSIEYADCLWRLGINCDHRGAYSEGLANLKQASEIYKNHPLIAEDKLSKIDRGLGHLYSETGRFKEAEDALSASILISNKLVDKRVHDLGRALLLKGKMYQKQKKYKQAFLSYRKSVDVFRSNLKHGHLSISQALDSYSNLLALLLLDKDLNNTASATIAKKEARLRTLADAQLLNHRYYKAKDTLLSLKSFYEKNKLTDRFGYANCLEDLGECCLLLKELKEGLAFQAKSVKVYREVLSDRDGEAKALVNLALFERESGDNAKAFSTLSKAKTITKQIHGQHSLAYGECLQVEFKWLLKDGELEKLKPLLVELSQVYESVSIPKSTDDRKQLKQAMLALELHKRDRFNEHLWADWRNTDKNLIF